MLLACLLLFISLPAMVAGAEFELLLGYFKDDNICDEIQCQCVDDDNCTKCLPIVKDYDVTAACCWLYNNNCSYVKPHPNAVEECYCVSGSASLFGCNNCTKGMKYPCLDCNDGYALVNGTCCPIPSPTSSPTPPPPSPSPTPSPTFSPNATLCTKYRCGCVDDNGAAVACGRDIDATQKCQALGNDGLASGICFVYQEAQGEECQCVADLPKNKTFYAIKRCYTCNAWLSVGSGCVRIGAGSDEERLDAIATHSQQSSLGFEENNKDISLCDDCLVYCDACAFGGSFDPVHKTCCGGVEPPPSSSPLPRYAVALIVVGVLLLLGAAGGGGFYFYRKGTERRGYTAL